jgi:hypothetical protein
MVEWVDRMRLPVVTGAPGAGKSTVLAELLGRRSEYLFFDVDWLAETGSRLSGRSVYTEAAVWPAYRRLWLDVLVAVARNRRQPVIFAPWNAADLAEVDAGRNWRVDWLLLDCADGVRRARLRGRAEWTGEMEEEAIADAGQLRLEIARRTDTGVATVGEVASVMLAWLDAP